MLVKLYYLWPCYSAHNTYINAYTMASSVLASSVLAIVLTNIVKRCISLASEAWLLLLLLLLLLMLLMLRVSSACTQVCVGTLVDETALFRVARAPSGAFDLKVMPQRHHNVWVVAAQDCTKCLLHQPVLSSFAVASAVRHQAAERNVDASKRTKGPLDVDCVYFGQLAQLSVLREVTPELGQDDVPAALPNRRVEELAHHAVHAAYPVLRPFSVVRGR